MQLRIPLYEKRKDYLVSKLEKDFQILKNKVRFIKAVVNDELIIAKVKRQVLADTLFRQKYAKKSDLDKILKEQVKLTIIRNSEDNNNQV